MPASITVRKCPIPNGILIFSVASLVLLSVSWAKFQEDYVFGSQDFSSSFEEVYKFLKYSLGAFDSHNRSYTGNIK